MSERKIEDLERSISPKFEATLNPYFSPPRELHGSQRNKISSIEKVNCGFIATVGCRRFVFKTIKELNEAIALFFTDYDKAAEKYLDEVTK